MGMARRSTEAREPTGGKEHIGRRTSAAQFLENA